MQSVITARLDEVTKARHQKPEQVIAEAVEIGLRKMWVDSVLAQYLKKRISRRKAVQLVGLDLVKLVELQDKVVQDDVEWGLTRAASRR